MSHRRKLVRRVSTGRNRTRCASGQRNPIVRPNFSIRIRSIDRECLGKAKYVSPVTSASPSYGAWRPPAVSTYPPSYILTDAPPPLPSSNVYRPSILCPPDRSWRVPDPHDCSIYHDCYHGKDLVSYCPAQLQYNREKQTCDHAVNVQCENKCTEANDLARFIDLTSCCHYYQCSSGRLTRLACPHPNLFDVQTRTCLPYKRVKCDGRRQCLSKCEWNSSRLSDSTMNFRSLSVQLRGGQNAL